MAWGRGFLKIKTECKKVNAPLPLIDAENGGVSISASGCEKYMSMLRYGQYGQVGADGVWRDEETVSKKNSDKKAAIKNSDKIDLCGQGGAGEDHSPAGWELFSGRAGGDLLF